MPALVGHPCIKVLYVSTCAGGCIYIHIGLEFLVSVGVFIYLFLFFFIGYPFWLFSPDLLLYLGFAVLFYFRYYFVVLGSAWDGMVFVWLLKVIGGLSNCPSAECH